VVRDGSDEGGGMTAESVNQRVGARVRAARDATGMTQNQLAGYMGLSRTSIANIEAGRQALDLEGAALVARVLRIAVGDLIAADDLPPLELPPVPHKVTIRRSWEVVCETCDGLVIGSHPVHAAALKSKQLHIDAKQAGAS
jgi:transcriptional regulator with XRE-family HTH domain